MLLKMFFLIAISFSKKLFSECLFPLREAVGEATGGDPDTGGLFSSPSSSTVSRMTSGEEEGGPNADTVQYIKFVAYSVVAYLIVAVGMLGNVLSLVVLTRPNLKGVMYVYLLGLAVSNLCALMTAVPALFDISSGLGGGDYPTAFYQAHLEMPLINSFMASSVYIIIFMTVNRYISIYKPTDFQRIHTLKNARLCISLSFLCGVLLHIPLCFQNKVVFTQPCSSSLPGTNSSLVTSLVTNSSIETTLTEDSCGWQSIENMFVSDTYIFKIYLVISEIFLRVGPIITLAILNTLIIHKFLKIAKKRQSMKDRVVTKPEVSSAGGLSSASSSPQPSRNTSSTTGTSTTSASTCSAPGAVHQLVVPGTPARYLTCLTDIITCRVSSIFH